MRIVLSARLMVARWIKPVVVVDQAKDLLHWSLATLPISQRAAISACRYFYYACVQQLSRPIVCSCKRMQGNVCPDSFITWGTQRVILSFTVHLHHYLCVFMFVCCAFLCLRFSACIAVLALASPGNSGRRGAVKCTITVLHWRKIWGKR